MCVCAGGGGEGMVCVSRCQHPHGKHNKTSLVGDVAAPMTQPCGGDHIGLWDSMLALQANRR